MATLTFDVRRKEPVLVRPAAATPRETKRLSDIDQQVSLRKHVTSVFFYRGRALADDHRDPVAVIRRALGDALVPYYPLAGRLPEAEGRKLAVDCTSEGVLFVEADADVRLAGLEAAGQVTRLLCGGFVLAFRISHIICDGVGAAQFMSAVAELARGLPSPTISPTWSRELLQVRGGPSKPPPQSAAPKPPPPPSRATVTRMFTFGPREIAVLKACLPPRLRETATTFELLTTALWRARTAALELPPDEHVSLLIYYNIRGLRKLGLPAGYYGNAIVVAAARATAGELLVRSLGGAVEQVKEVKAAITAGFGRSTSDPLMLRRWADLGLPNAFRVSDLRRAAFHRLDFGWGEPAYNGRVNTDVCFLRTVNNGGRENSAVAVTIVLPRAAMDRFASMLQMLLAPHPATPASRRRRARI